MNLLQYVEDLEAPTRSLVLANRSAPRPIERMLEGLFEGQPVEVDVEDAPDAEGDVVYLLEEGEVVATSPLEELQTAILMVNSDLFITGIRELDEVDLPDVIAGLDEVRFRLRGYPESNKEKLLLIVISRYIERLAHDGDGGRHRASFQRLSRIDDEQGTRTVYRRLADTGTDVHVYGLPDWTPPPEFEVTMHGGWDGDFRDSWFVVYVPEDDDATHAALVAIEVESRRWDGFWTYDPDLVADIEQYIMREL